MPLAYPQWPGIGIIGITNTPTLDGYQCRVYIPWQAGMRQDFADLRFTDSRGNKLYYWLETGNVTSGVGAYVWVRVPIGASVLYFYFGYKGASSESNGSAVFESGGFDDFLGTTLSSAWSTTSNVTISVSGGIVTVAWGSGGWVGIYANSTFGVGYTVRSRFKNGDTTKYQAVGWGGLIDANTAIYELISGQAGSMLDTLGYTGNTLTVHSYSDDTNWHTMSIRRVSSSSLVYMLDADVQSTNNANIATINLRPVLASYNGSNIQCDWIAVGKCQTNEPVLSIIRVQVNPGYYYQNIGRAVSYAPPADLVLTEVDVSPHHTLDYGIVEALTMAETDVSSHHSPAASSPVLSLMMPMPNAFARHVPVANPVQITPGTGSLNIKHFEISKTIQDALWKADIQVDGEASITPFSNIDLYIPDANGNPVLMFHGMIPGTQKSLAPANNQTNFTAYDYAWYLSVNYVPKNLRVTDGVTDPSQIIMDLLGGASWAGTTGIMPQSWYLVPGWGTTLPKVQWSWTAKTTLWKAIQDVCSYCGMVFVVSFENIQGMGMTPVASFVPYAHIDDYVSGALSRPATITNPDPTVMGPVTTEQRQYEMYNKVVIEGSDSSGNRYTGTAQVPYALPITYHEEDSKYNTQAICDSRAQALLTFFQNQADVYNMEFSGGIGYTLYQQLNFVNFPEIPTTPMRVIGIKYSMDVSNGLEIRTKIQFTSDQNLSAQNLLFRSMNADIITETTAVVNNALNTQPVNMPGTVLAIINNATQATVENESGNTITARILSTVTLGAKGMLIPDGMGGYVFLPSGTSQTNLVDFTASPLLTGAGSRVSFSGITTLASVSAWNWDFGDGNTGTGANTTHTYNAIGIYTVKLTVTTSIGTFSAVKNNLITVVAGTVAQFPVIDGFFDSSLPMWDLTGNVSCSNGICTITGGARPSSPSFSAMALDAHYMPMITDKVEIDVTFNADANCLWGFKFLDNNGAQNGFFFNNVLGIVMGWQSSDSMGSHYLDTQVASGVTASGWHTWHIRRNGNVVTFYNDTWTAIASYTCSTYPLTGTLIGAILDDSYGVLQLSSFELNTWS